MKKMFIWVISVLSLFISVNVFAAVPRSPSEVSVRSNHLIVKKRLSDGTLSQPNNFYIIRGLTWSPSTRAPATGPNPLNTSQNVSYGFFSDWSGRIPQGHDVLKYWKENQHSQLTSDIQLMKNMNVNTVRLYSDFFERDSLLTPVLDEFYNKGIMVILSAANSRDDIDDLRFDVFSNTGSVYNHYIPTGWMGDAGDLTYKEESGRDTNSVIKITYSAASSTNKWAGIFWQYPDNNWGDYAGLDLRAYNKLVFKAKGAVGGEIINKVFIGIEGKDTAHAEIGPIILTNQWQEYSINLSAKDLANIRGGFGFTVEKANGARVFWLEDIYFAQDSSLGAPRGEAKYKKIVRLYKDHPAVLAWSLGNEWNLASAKKFHGYETIADAAQAVNRAALGIKSIDTNHPVTSCLGDDFGNIPEILVNAPSVDLWGLNIYRSNLSNFQQLFADWNALTTKPFYLSEIGTDSFYTTFHTLVPGTNKAAYCRGGVNEPAQKDFLLSLWNNVQNNLNIYGYDKQCVGALVHEFNDELWKIGNFHEGLGDLVDYDGPDNILGNADDDASYGTYNADGLELINGHPDDVANEEYFGVVDADRTPKQAYAALTQYYSSLDGVISSNTIQSPLFPRGWNLVSVSATPQNASTNVIFRELPTFLNSIWGLNAQTQRYNHPDLVEKGKSYWVYFASPAALGLVGQAITQDVQLNLSKGWNLIGNPFTYNVPLANLTVTYNGQTKSFTDANSAGWINGFVWGWRADIQVYDAVNLMEGWKGYWFYVRDRCPEGVILKIPAVVQRGVSKQTLMRGAAGSLSAPENLTTKISSLSFSNYRLTVSGENLGAYVNSSQSYVELTRLSTPFANYKYRPRIVKNKWKDSSIICETLLLLDGKYSVRVVNSPVASEPKQIEIKRGRSLIR